VAAKNQRITQGKNHSAKNRPQKESKTLQRTTKFSTARHRWPGLAGSGHLAIARHRSPFDGSGEAWRRVEPKWMIRWFFQLFDCFCFFFGFFLWRASPPLATLSPLPPPLSTFDRLHRSLMLFWRAMEAGGQWRAVETKWRAMEPPNGEARHRSPSRPLRPFWMV